MPSIRCSGCGTGLTVNVGGQFNSAIEITGSVFCKGCKSRTGFVIEYDNVAFVSGKTYGNFSDKAPSASKIFYVEAESCFFQGAPNAAAAMCRACVEAALEKYSGDLYNKIEEAKKAGVLNDVEVSLAHGSRLITREAIHRLDLVNMADIPSMLSAAVQIVKKLFP